MISLELADTWKLRNTNDTQFIRPTKDAFIRIFGEKGEEVFSINVKISAAVTYPSDTSDHTLKFNISGYELPLDQPLYMRLDPGKHCDWSWGVTVHVDWLQLVGCMVAAHNQDEVSKSEKGSYMTSQSFHSFLF